MKIYAAYQGEPALAKRRAEGCQGGAARFPYHPVSGVNFQVATFVAKRVLVRPQVASFAYFCGQKYDKKYSNIFKLRRKPQSLTIYYNHPQSAGYPPRPTKFSASVCTQISATTPQCFSNSSPTTRNPRSRSTLFLSSDSFYCFIKPFYHVRSSVFLALFRLHI